jgi:hypothetical protein
MPPPEAQATLLARHNAKRAAMAQWRSEGRKLSDLSASDIRQLADAWMLAHPEIVEDARAVVAEWMAKVDPAPQ